MPILGISLDAAGTVIEPREAVAATYTRLANGHGIPIDEASIAHAFRTVFPRMPPLAFGAVHGDALQRQERDWWRTLVRNCLGRFGQHSGFNAFFEEVYEHYAQAGAWRVFDDTAPLLAALQAQRIPVVMVSNFDSRLHGILREFDLHEAFRDVLCSSAVGSAKPDAGIFNAACAALRVDAAQVLHIGDDRRADYEGARAAGLQAKWLKRKPDGDDNPNEVATLGDALVLIGAKPA